MWSHKNLIYKDYVFGFSVGVKNIFFTMRIEGTLTRQQNGVSLFKNFALAIHVHKTIDNLWPTL